MGFIGHKKYVLFSKGIFALLYVILLGSQLSVKFYLCANSPIGANRVDHRRVMLGKQARPDFAARFVRKNCASYSLDKRYHFKHHFTLLYPQYNYFSCLPQDKEQISLHEGVFVHSFAYVNLLRGPPAL
jgi:hypothetical protein